MLDDAAYGVAELRVRSITHVPYLVCQKERNDHDSSVAKLHRGGTKYEIAWLHAIYLVPSCPVRLLISRAHETALIMPNWKDACREDSRSDRHILCGRKSLAIFIFYCYRGIFIQLERNSVGKRGIHRTCSGESFVEICGGK